MSKVAGVIGGLFGAATLAWAGTAYYSSSTFDKSMTLAMSQNTGQLELSQIHADHGMLSSTGIMGWKFATGCEAGNPVVSGQVHYKVNHAPSFSGATTMDSTITLEGDYGRQLEAMGNSKELVQAVSTYSYGGKWHSEFTTPKIALDSDDMSVRISASKGTWVGDQNAGVMKWTLGQINGSLQGNAGRFTMKGVSMDMDLQDVILGIGHGEYKVEEISADGGQGKMQATGLSIKQSAVINGNAIDTVVTPTVKLITAPQIPEVRNVGAKFSMLGVDQKAYLELSTMNTASICDEFADNEKQFLMIEKAVAEILDRGWVFALDDLKAEVDGGSFDGNLKVGFAAAKSGSGETLANRFSVDANVTAQGAIIPPGFDEMLLGTGYLRKLPNGDGVTGTVQMRDGEVQINGEADEDLGAQFQFFMDIGDSQMQEWRASLDRNESMFAGLFGSNI